MESSIRHFAVAAYAAWRLQHDGFNPNTGKPSLEWDQLAPEFHQWLIAYTIGLDEKITSLFQDPVNPIPLEYKNKLLAGRGLITGEISEHDFLNSPVTVNDRPIYDFPGETIESLKALWDGAPESLKSEINADIAAMDALEKQIRS